MKPNKPAPPTESSSVPEVPNPETLVTEADVNAALAALDVARAHYNAIIDGAPAAEDALLEAPEVDDHQMLRLSMRVRHARRQLEKLDRTERQLVERGSAASGEARDRLWVQYAAAYRAAAEDCEPLAAALREAYRKLNAVHYNATAVLGFVGFDPFPRPPPLYDLERLASLIDSARSPSLMVPRQINNGPPLYCVEFNRFFYEQTFPNRGWQKDQQAGFPAYQAWRLVELGIARFVGRAPAKPVGYKSPFKWQVEAAQRDNV